MSATIYDLAEAAGVSISTVSKALNDSYSISEKTKKRIQEIADSMGYKPNARANGVLIEYDPNKNIYLLLGGSDRNQGYNDAWLLLLNENKWEKLSIPELNNIYTPRSGVAFSLIENNNNIL